MKYVIESIEDNIVVLIADNNEKIRIPASELSFTAKEGMILELSDGMFSYSEEETLKRKRELFNKQKLVFRKKTD